MTKQIAIRTPDEDAKVLDAVVEGGRHSNRTAAIRAAIGLLARVEREREIEAEYRRADGDGDVESTLGPAAWATVLAQDAGADPS